MRFPCLYRFRSGPHCLPLICWIIGSLMIIDSASGSDPSPFSRLRFKNGDYASGKLHATDQSNRIAWQSPHFLEPMLINIEALQSIDAPPNTESTPSIGEFAFELTTGDKFWGQISTWTQEGLTIESNTLGRVTFDPKLIRYIRRWGSDSKVLYQGPQSLDTWKALDDNLPWQMESGSLVSHHKGAKVRGSVNIPKRAQIDLRLSWSTRPGFVVTLGANAKQSSTSSEFSLEVWDDKLALVRDIGTKTDAVHLQPLEPRNSFVELTIYLDQEAGVAAVYSDRGRKLGSITLPLEQPKSGEFILIENYERELRLDLLRVQSWQSDLPVESSTDGGVIVSQDGTQYAGSVASLDDQRSLEIVKENQASLLPLAQVREINQTHEAANIEAGSVTLMLKDQSRLTGKWISCDGEHIRFQIQGAQGPSDLAVEQLTAVRGSPVEFLSPRPDGVREGQFFAQDTLLHGHFLESSPMTNASCLHWKGRQVENALHVLNNVQGRIDFRRIEQRANVNRQPNATSLAQNANRGNAIRRTVPNISLRSGDLILAEVEKIDEWGVTFKSSSSSTTFVPNEQVQVIEMRRIRRERTQAAQKMARLLTVPRMRKNDPPTHLVASVDGDYLRGRIVSMDAEKLLMEVNLEQMTIPTENIAQLIWLHDRAWNDASNPSSKETKTSLNPDAGNESTAAVDPPKGPFQVHVVERIGWKMTFEPERIENDILVGTSALLGKCNVPIKNIDLLLLGTAVDQQARELNANPWTLALAKQPRVYEEAEAEQRDGLAGSNSPLVGKPAPKLEGETLDGESFRLADMQGEVIVLDFWASWCGPCMQTMPVVDSVVTEVGQGKATLVAVNLEEPADRAQTALDRLKLKTKVVLDIDGAAARRYEANAIPQTVIVDRQGIIRYVFVGGGPKFADQLRAALTAVLADEAN